VLKFWHDRAVVLFRFLLQHRFNRLLKRRMPPSPDAIATLRARFSGRLLVDSTDKAAYLTDWRGRWTGQAWAVALPDTTDDVAAIVRWCADHRVPIVPQGGNTGMSGGATPDDSGEALVLSLTRMNRVRSVDPVNNTMTVDAGCILQNLQDVALAHDRLFPLSLAPEGSCVIGGNLATNAGGVAVLRYGNARELCLGLEVVTPQGEIWDGLRGLRKDNTGYDLRDLYIGSEGTLGVITAATLKLFPLPRAQRCAWAAVATLDDALRLLAMAQQHLAARLTAFEVMSKHCVDLLSEQLPDVRWPLAAPTQWAVLIEISEPTNDANARSALEGLLETALEQGCIQDAVVAENITQSKAFWAGREQMAEAQSKAGKNIKHDISIPISRIPAFVAETNAAIEHAYPGVRMIVFGHLGDGNLHYNVSPRKGERGEDFIALEAPINKITHDAVARYAGSVSAEHGLGVLRREEAARYKSPVEIQLMKTIKSALDPQHIMNPGKGLPL
jgi:FAD/FMN-containing dehydrogenase